MWNIAPNKIIDNIAAEILEKTPTTSNTSPINSSSVIDNCSSGRIHIEINHSCQLGSNFFILCTMNITPIDALIPQ